MMCDGSDGLECCDRHGVARIGLSGPGTELVVM